MARKPTPAAGTPAAATTPPAAAAPASAPAPEVPAASPPADAAATDTGNGATEGAPNGTLIGDRLADEVNELTDRNGAAIAAAVTGLDGAAAGDDDLDPNAMYDARVLIAFDEHLPDDIVSGTLDELGVLERDGKVDTHADAVAYARSQKA